MKLGNIFPLLQIISFIKTYVFIIIYQLSGGMSIALSKRKTTRGEVRRGGGETKSGKGNREMQQIKPDR